MIPYVVSVATLAAITAILCLGVNISWGWVGQLDLGYYVYVAVGAYMYAVLRLPPTKPQPGLNWGYVLGLNIPFVPSLILAAASGAAASTCIGLLALRRIRSDYLAIITVVSALMAYAILGQPYWLFGGQIGVYNVPRPFNSLIHLGPNDYDAFYLGLMIVCLILVYAVLELLYKSPFGMSLRAVRESEKAAAAFGRNVFTLRLRAYVLGGTVGGFGGALLLNYVSAWNPSSWSTFEVVLILSGVVVGGRANSRGVILGSVLVLAILPELTRLVPVLGGSSAAGPAVAVLISSGLIIVIMRFRPAGLLPERKTLDADLGSRRSPSLRSLRDLLHSPDHSSKVPS